MAKPLSFGKIEVNIYATEAAPRGVPEPETPFRIALLGDFSNRAGRGMVQPAPDLAGRRPVLVDRDNFDQVLAQFGVALHLPIGTGPDRITLHLAALEDFHPDRICERVEAFRLLRNMRKRLSNPATFAAAAAEIQAWTKTETAPAVHESTQEQSSSAPDLSRLSSDKLLEQILGEPQSQASAARLPQSEKDWNAFLRQIVAPHLIPKTNPRQAELVAQLEAAMASQMRVTLHDPTFQAVEAVWRAVFFLVQRLETSAQLQLYLLDVSKAELAADLSAAEDLRSTATYRLLVEQSVGTPGGQPWAVLAGNYTFDHSREDVELLGRLAKIARQAEAPFLAAASPQVLGCLSWAETPDPDDWQQPVDPQDRQAWETLRQLPETAYLGLIVPRFLLRLPYGSDTDPTEQFAFEEFAESSGHEEYLWGNPAFVCVYLLAEAFSQYGWDLYPGIIQEIEGLPLHIYKKDGGSLMQPCAEAWLTERAAEHILDKGLMPLLSIRGRDTVRLARFQSLANPVTSLAGRWSG